MTVAELAWVSPEVAVLTFTRPEAANSINSDLESEIERAVKEVGSSEEAKVLIITGAGRHFCGGVDLKDREQGLDSLGGLRNLVDGIAALRQIVIAAINGACMGGGTEIALACDLRLAVRSAKIGLPEIKFGGLPALGGPQRLARIVGPARAKYMVCSGRSHSADEAASFGLVDEVVDDDVAGRSLELALELSAHAAYALRTAKSVIDRGVALPLESALRMETEAINQMATLEQQQAEIDKSMSSSGTYAKIFGGISSGTRKPA